MGRWTVQQTGFASARSDSAGTASLDPLAGDRFDPASEHLIGTGAGSRCRAEVANCRYAHTSASPLEQ
jgi:hypothetical protein